MPSKPRFPSHQAVAKPPTRRGPGLRRHRAAVAVIATALVFLAFATASLASVGSVFYDGSSNAAAGGTLFGSLTTGSENVGLGPYVMTNLTSGFQNTAIGN